MRTAAAAAGAAFRDEIGFHEICVLAGACLVARGLWEIRPAYAWIALGLILLYLGTWHWRVSTTDRRR